MLYLAFKDRGTAPLYGGYLAYGKAYINLILHGHFEGLEALGCYKGADRSKKTESLLKSKAMRITSAQMSSPPLPADRYWSFISTYTKE